MPARTNEFQELVALIEKSLAPLGAKVTESAMVPTPKLSDLTEIDVLIEHGTDPFHMKIAYEARDTGRRFSKTSFNELFGKYVGNSGVPVDKFVFVSSSGFTRGALQRAAAENVELLTIGQALGKNWADAKSRMQGFATAGLMSFALGPKWEGIEFGPDYERGRLECPKGHDHGTPVEYARTQFDRWWSVTPLRVPKFADNEHREKVFDTSVPVGLTGWKLRFDGLELPVQVMVLHARVRYQQELAEHLTYERSSTTDGTKEIHHIKGLRAETIFTAGPPIRVRYANEEEAKKFEQRDMQEALRSVFPDGIAFKIAGKTLQWKFPPLSQSEESLSLQSPPQPHSDSEHAPRQAEDNRRDT